MNGPDFRPVVEICFSCYLERDIGQADRCSQNINLWMWFSFSFSFSDFRSWTISENVHKASLWSKKKSEWNEILLILDTSIDWERSKKDPARIIRWITVQKLW
jgi:hypothetical protein